MIWKVILRNLVEAHGDLRELRAWLHWLDTGRPVNGWPKESTEWAAKKGRIRPGVIAVMIEHIYHHLNWAWNCRNADEARAIRCDNRAWGNRGCRKTDGDGRVEEGQGRCRAGLLIVTADWIY